MNRRHRNSLLTLLALTGVGAAIALYAQNAGFTESWRQLIENEFGKRGYEVEVERLTLGPLEGLVAENVRFYQEPSHQTEIASIDRVILDVDLGRILEKELSLNSVDFEDASVSLPVDPGNPESQRLSFENFSARAVMSPQDVEIVHASAVIHGMPVSLKGHLHGPPPQKIDAQSEKTKKQMGLERRQQLERITQRLRVFGEILAQLEQFTFPEMAQEHGIKLEITGDIADTDTFVAKCEIELGTIQRGSLAFEQLRALIEFDGRRLSLRELLVRDASGELRLNAEWPLDSQSVQFRLESSIDAPRILTSLSNRPELGEIVFFTPPEVQFEGTWLIDVFRSAREADGSLGQFPLIGVGNLSCDRVTSRGVVFDSFKSDFSVTSDKAYFRNLRLDHKTGIAQANLLYDLAEGLRYQAEIKFDPQVLLPFVSDERVSRHLMRWSFDEESTVYIGVEGSGPGPDAAGWQNSGVIDLRRCRLGGVDLLRFQSDFESRRGHHTFQNLRIDRPEGVASATSIVADIDSGRVAIDSLKSELNFPELSRLVNTQLATQLAPVDFAQAPNISIHGEVDIRDAEQRGDAPVDHDIRVDFESSDAAECRLFGHTVTLSAPQGSLHMLGSDMNLSSLKGGVFGGNLELEFAMNGLLDPSSAPPLLNGRFALRDAMLFARQPLEPLASQLIQILPRTEDLSDSPAAASADFTIENATLQTVAIQIETDSLEINAAARVNLRSLKLKGEATANAVSSAADPASEQGETGPAVFEVGGTLRKAAWTKR